MNRNVVGKLDNKEAVDNTTDASNADLDEENYVGQILNYFLGGSDNKIKNGPSHIPDTKNPNVIENESELSLSQHTIHHSNYQQERNQESMVVMPSSEYRESSHASVSTKTNQPGQPMIRVSNTFQSGIIDGESNSNNDVMSKENNVSTTPSVQFFGRSSSCSSINGAAVPLMTNINDLYHPNLSLSMRSTNRAPSSSTSSLSSLPVPNRVSSSSLSSSVVTNASSALASGFLGTAVSTPDTAISSSLMEQQQQQQKLFPQDQLRQSSSHKQLLMMLPPPPRLPSLPNSTSPTLSSSTTKTAALSESSVEYNQNSNMGMPIDQESDMTSNFNTNSEHRTPGTTPSSQKQVETQITHGYLQSPSFVSYMEQVYRMPKEINSNENATKNYLKFPDVSLYQQNQFYAQDSTQRQSVGEYIDTNAINQQVQHSSDQNQTKLSSMHGNFFNPYDRDQLAPGINNVASRPTRSTSSLESISERINESPQQFFFAPSLSTNPELSGSNILSEQPSFNQLAATIAQQQQELGILSQSISNEPLVNPMISPSFPMKNSTDGTMYNKIASIDTSQSTHLNEQDSVAVRANSSIAHFQSNMMVTDGSLMVSNNIAPTLQPVESEEKRARRLARNRESARLSRRRKKERLITLSHKVNQLHDKLDSSRRQTINAMEGEFRKRRNVEISKLCKRSELKTSSDSRRYETDCLINIVHNLAPNANIRRSVASYQYSTAKQLFLPPQDQFMIWLSLQPESVLTSAKEVHSKSNTGKASSKQIGEELFRAQRRDSGSIISCSSNDRDLFWPLFCYEFSLSVEQEDRFLQSHKVKNHAVNIARLRERYSNIAAAERVIAGLKKSTLYQSDLVTHHSESSLLRILTPDQSARLLTWLNNPSNAAKSRKVLLSSKSANKRDFDIRRLDQLCQAIEKNLAVHDNPPST